MALLLLVLATYGVSAQCSAPSGLSTSGITATAATARWEPVSGATSYNVDYKPPTYSFWINIANATTSLQWSLYGMEANTTYEWRVSANCSGGTSSYTYAQFTTLGTGSCAPPGGLFTSNIQSSTATMNWSPVNGAFAYTVHYKPASSGTWIVASSGTYSTAYNLYGLSAGTTYDWRVYSNCSLTEASTFSTTQFTTSGSSPAPPVSSCPGPFDISTNGTPGGAAEINMNTDVKGTIETRNDVDHYRFTVSSYGTINVWLTTLPANYDLAVLNSSGAQIGISQNSGSKNESVSLLVHAGTYYARVFPKGTANNSRSCYTLKVQSVTATRVATSATAAEVNENSNFAINLYPNPASDQLNLWVDGIDKKAEIRIYDLTGKLVMQKQSGNTLTQLNISRLSSGIYMVKVNNGKETRAAKFVKQ